MTHAEALANDPREFPGRDCPGELVGRGRFPDRRIARDGPVSTVVAVYRCAHCGCMLSIEDDTGAVRNCYPFAARDPG